MQAAVERMKREYLQRDSNPWEWGTRRGTPVDVRGVLEILVGKEQSRRCIGKVAKLDCTF